MKSNPHGRKLSPSIMSISLTSLGIEVVKGFRHKALKSVVGPICCQGLKKCPSTQLPKGWKPEKLEEALLEV